MRQNAAVSSITAAAGVRAFTAQMLSENALMLQVFADSGPAGCADTGAPPALLDVAHAAAQDRLSLAAQSGARQ